MTINEAVRAAMDEWKQDGTTSVAAMRELIEQLVADAIDEWAEDNGLTEEDDEDWS